MFSGGCGRNKPTQEQINALNAQIAKEMESQRMREAEEKKKREEEFSDEYQKKFRSEQEARNTQKESQLAKYISPIIGTEPTNTPHIRGNVVIVVLKGSATPPGSWEGTFAKLDKKPAIDGLAYDFHEYSWDDRQFGTPNDFALYKLLPQDLRTTDPAVAGTIACVRWHKKEVAQYGLQQSEALGLKPLVMASADQVFCTLSLIDKVQNRLLLRKEFAGTRPKTPAKVSASLGDSIEGTWPLKEVAEYLEQLPRVK
jgi:hypothetical protein